MSAFHLYRQLLKGPKKGNPKVYHNWALCNFSWYRDKYIVGDDMSFGTMVGELFNYCIYRDDLVSMMYLRKYGNDMIIPSALEQTCRYGRFRLMRWLLAYQNMWRLLSTEMVLTLLCLFGHLDMIKWYLAHDHWLDPQQCMRGIKRMQRSVVDIMITNKRVFKYLRRYGYVVLPAYYSTAGWYTEYYWYGLEDGGFKSEKFPPARLSS